MFYAHSENKLGQMETVGEHLQRTAELAQKFAGAWGGEQEARAAAIFHDIGKYTETFQNVLIRKEKGINHWTLGARALAETYKLDGICAAIAVQGHHGGLSTGLIGSGEDGLNAQIKMGEERDQENRKYSGRDVGMALGYLSGDGISLPGALKSRFGDSYRNKHYLTAMLETRMLFSALVDADYLATDGHFHAGENGYRAKSSDLKLDAGAYLCKVLGEIAKKRADSKAAQNVLKLRDAVLEQCLEKATLPQGLFTLNAPTGAGKTLATMAFALKHAQRHGLERVIIVLPYLNIIEQTASQFETLFGKEAVLQDHSLAEIKDNEDESRLLAENWDAPIVITTTVRFFEALFASRTSVCRRLHAIANSMILFDEAQTMPLQLSAPTLAALQALIRDFKCSVMFSTATQPPFALLSEHVRAYSGAPYTSLEILQDTQELFRLSQRVEIHAGLQRKSIEELAAELSGVRQALVIVNLRPYCKKIFEALNAAKEEGRIPSFYRYVPGTPAGNAAHRAQAACRKRALSADFHAMRGDGRGHRLSGGLPRVCTAGSDHSGGGGAATGKEGVSERFSSFCRR